MNRNIKIIVFPLICYLFLSLNSIAQELKFGFEIDNGNRSVTIPFRLINNLIVIDVLFEGVIPLKFIIDTGVSNTVLIEKTFADILNIEPDRTLTLIGAAGGKEVEAFIVNSVTINLKGVSGSHIPLLVLKEDYLKLEQSMGIKVHGILGYELFKNFITYIDYSSHLITFYKPSSFNRKLWFYDKLDLSIESSKPYITSEVLLEDSTRIKTKLMIDTGASHSLMLHQNSDDRIVLPKKNIRDVLGAGIAGEIEGYVGRVPQLLLGEHFLLEDVIARFPDEGTYKDVILNTNRNGTLGGGVLRRFDVYLDYQNERLFLRKNKAFRHEFTYDMSGMSVIAKGEMFLEPYYVIDDIRPNTPADVVGLRVNDVILRMNGHSGSDLNLSLINESLRKKPGKKIKLLVKRGDEKFQVEFILKEFI